MRQLNLVTEEFFLTTKSPNRPEKISWETVLLGEFVVHPMKFFRVVSVFRCKKKYRCTQLTDYRKINPKSTADPTDPTDPTDQNL